MSIQQIIIFHLENIDVKLYNYNYILMYYTYYVGI